MVFVIGIQHYPPLTLLTSDAIHIYCLLPNPFIVYHCYHIPHARQFKDVAKLDEAAIDAAINGGGEAKQ